MIIQPFHCAWVLSGRGWSSDVPSIERVSLAFLNRDTGKFQVIRLESEVSRRGSDQPSDHLACSEI